MTDGSLIVIAVVVVILAGLAIGLFTPYGSGISPRPWGRGRSGGQAGAEGPEEPSGRDEGEHATFQHGTR